VDVPATPASALCLLVIEDDVDQQELIAETLEDQFTPGCVTIAATCAAVRAMDPAGFDLILCDVNLPDGNGLDLLTDHLAGSGRPVMMLTGENDVATAREAIRRGAVDYVVKAGSYLLTMPITVEKNLAMGGMAAQRDSAQRALQNKNRRLETELADAEQRASTDPLTGLYNRRAFGRVSRQLFADAYRGHSDLCCIMIDMDNFKDVNDTLGHAVGDDLIRDAARSINANLRQMDVACRYGGDEFVLLLPRTDEQMAIGVANRIRKDYALASTTTCGEARTMSIGIAATRSANPRSTCPAGPEALLARADQALYEAKDAGRNHVTAAAFTLVELLIVVTILGILAMLVIPQMTDASAEARQEAFAANMRDLARIASVYHQEHGALPPQEVGQPVPEVMLATVGRDEFPLDSDLGGFWHVGKMPGADKWGVGVAYTTADAAAIEAACLKLDAAIDDGSMTGGRFYGQAGLRYYWLIE
jgi:diguanylate cyclase (GGDEF)-like protein